MIGVNDTDQGLMRLIFITLEDRKRIISPLLHRRQNERCIPKMYP